MKDFSLEERVLASALNPSQVDMNKLSGRTDIQYLEEGKKIIDHFKDSLKEAQKESREIIQFATTSQGNFIGFFDHLEECWRVYLELSSRMASFSENLQFLYPEKVALFSDMVKTTFELNEHIYLITDIEKEIYEKQLESLPEDRLLPLIESARSFPVYLSEEVGENGVVTKNPYEIRELLRKNPNLRKLFSLSGSSVQTFGKLLSHFSPLGKKVNRTNFVPQNKHEQTLQGILIYDHFFELFLREGGILMNDLKFYVDLSERLSCAKEIPTIIKKLDEARQNLQLSFNPNLPQYLQTGLSCGATCLSNVVGTYFPHIKVDRSMEEGILKLVTARGFPNNIPSSLAYVAAEKFGIPARFFADFRTFAPRFINTPATQEPLKKFQEDYAKIKSSAIDYGSITLEDIRAKLESGHLISFVGEAEDLFLHYSMIVGYNFRGDNNHFLIFDPLHGTSKMPSSKVLRYMRNRESLWGIEYLPPESVIFDSTTKYIAKARELSSWTPK
ncbi:Uncharacterised protein [uncultured archaeon]|nr:Uncharacterised protein [uncultured archaeon]